MKYWSLDAVLDLIKEQTDQYKTEPSKSVKRKVKKKKITMVSLAKKLTGFINDIENLKGIIEEQKKDVNNLRQELIKQEQELIKHRELGHEDLKYKGKYLIAEFFEDDLHNTIRFSDKLFSSKKEADEFVRSRHEATLKEVTALSRSKTFLVFSVSSAFIYAKKS